MPDLKLKRIEIRNFLTVKQSIVEFPDYGLVVVRGNNPAARGKFQSVGSGKTLLGEAISRTLIGVKGRYTEFGHFSRDGNGDTFVKLDTELRGKPLQVQLGYKCEELSRTGEGFKFIFDGSEIQRDRIQNTRDELIKVIRISPELAAWSVFLDGDRLKFNELTQKASVDLLMMALAQPAWTDFQRKANDTVSKFDRELAKDTSANEEAKQNLEESKLDLSQAEKALDEEQKDYNARLAEREAVIKEIKADIAREQEIADQSEKEEKAIKADLKLFEKENAELAHQIEIQRNALNDARDRLQEDEKTMLAETSKLEAQLERVQDDLASIENVPKTCPKCGKPWDLKHSESEIATLRKKETELKTKTKAADKKAKTVVGELERLDASVLKLTNDLRSVGHHVKIKALSQRYEQLEAILKAANKKIAILSSEHQAAKDGPDRTKLSQASSIVEERKRIVSKNSGRVTETAERLQETTTAHAVASYWQKAFSPNGIPNMILREAIQPLNDTARRISNLMTGGSIKIVYDTSRALATGQEKAELIVRVENTIGANRLEGNSKGEGGISNLIIAETLSEVGSISSKVGYRWYDELIALNQDEIVRKSIMSYLREIANRLQILVFIVCHHDDISNYADYELVAEKDGEGTSFYWR